MTTTKAPEKFHSTKNVEQSSSGREENGSCEVVEKSKRLIWNTPFPAIRPESISSKLSLWPTMLPACFPSHARKNDRNYKRNNV